MQHEMFLQYPNISLNIQMIISALGVMSKLNFEYI